MINNKKLFLIVIIAIGYYLGGKISFLFFQQDMVITIAAFIPEGIALAAVLLFGRIALPGIFIGQLILGLDSGLNMIPTLGIAFVNTIEAYIALILFEYFDLDRRLQSIRDVLGLIFLITFILQPFSALFGNIFLYYNASEAVFSIKNIFLWWFGNVMGQLLIAPMLLILYDHKNDIRRLNLLLVVIVSIVINYILQVLFSIHDVTLLLIITLPATIFLATKNLSYASVSSVILAVMSLYYTHLGIGAFSHNASEIDNIIDLNFFMISHIMLVLFIGVLFREKEEAIRALESMAHYDYLTALPNRHLLREEIHHTVYLAHSQGKKSAICFIDLDGFKQVNDTLGHHIGDEVLKETVNRIRAFTHSEDAFLRIGGDEFLLILNYSQSKEDVDIKLNSILSSVSEVIYIQGHAIEISLSMGVACCPEHGMTVEELMNASDSAMYEAKRRGKNQFFYASSNSNLS